MTISHDISFWKEPPPESAAFNACVTASEESTLLAPVNSGKATGQIPHGGPLPLSPFVPAWTHVLPSSRHFLNKNARYARCGRAASTNVSNLRNTTDALLFRPRQSCTHASSYEEWGRPFVRILSARKPGRDSNPYTLRGFFRHSRSRCATSLSAEAVATQGAQNCEKLRSVENGTVKFTLHPCVLF